MKPGRILFALLFFFPIALHAVDTPPRLYFSDAKLSFLIPEPWDLSSTFPYGPLLTRKTQEGTDAFIVCQISDAVNPAHLSIETSTDVLKNFAVHDITVRTGNPRILAAEDRALAGKNAYEVTWLSEGTEGVVQYQSVYFFMDNRFYALSLRAHRDSFPWIVQDFQTWLTSLNFLSRQDAGKLDSPSHGGVWIHQTGGIKISVPEEWLIGVADDRQVGAALARDKMHLSFTAVVDVSAASAKDMTMAEKDEERQVLQKNGYKILAESDDPFHGLPCFQITYEGTVQGRFIRGQDLWVSSAKARWLISIDGDAPLLRDEPDEWQTLLNGIQFYD